MYAKQYGAAVELFDRAVDILAQQINSDHRYDMTAATKIAERGASMALKLASNQQ